MLRELRAHEGWMAYRWAVSAAALSVGVWIPAFVGGVAAVNFIGGEKLLSAAAGTAITLALGAVGQSWIARRPWYQLLARRVAGYAEQGDPRDYARGMIRAEDLGPVVARLKRGGLNARAAITIGPPDAPELNCRLEVFRPVIVPPSGEEVGDATRRLLLDAGISGRVDGRFPNGDPVPLLPPVSSLG